MVNPDILNMFIYDYSNIKSKYKRFLKTKENAFFNALHVKFSYSITCHKAQGGEWDKVFVNSYYIPTLNWQYTAVTRASKQIEIF